MRLGILKINRVTRKIHRIVNKNPLKKLPLDPIDKAMGFARGTPIDRYYIEKFLKDNQAYIYGDVMEISESIYTDKFGHDINQKYIFTAEQINDDKIIIGDLETGEGCRENFVDCFILTQTLPFIYDVNSAAENILKMLKPGGTALITVSGISMISLYDYNRWGHFWGFTELSLRKLFEKFISKEKIQVISYGNSKAAAGFLYGLTQEDFIQNELDYSNFIIPVTIGMVVKKSYDNQK